MPTSIDDAHEITPLLSSRDLERVFGLGERTLRKLVADGTLPAPIRIGRARRWRHDDIVRSLDGLGAAPSEMETQDQSPDQQCCSEASGIAGN
jgi:predicted DNA-binding transcriptional regulator AlpA